MRNALYGRSGPAFSGSGSDNVTECAKKSSSKISLTITRCLIPIVPIIGSFVIFPFGAEMYGVGLAAAVFAILALPSIAAGCLFVACGHLAAGVSLAQLVAPTVLGTMISIIFALSLYGEHQRIEKACAMKVQTDYSTISKGVELYRKEHGAVPFSVDVLVREGYIGVGSSDPWGHPYGVTFGEIVHLVSSGPDGISGTSDDIDQP